uniref:Legumain n=1 Tax=Ditylenchus dipsaci TaxID=166011 RepID=A0A915DKR3_9BILA
MNKLIFGSIFLLLILVTQTSQSYSSIFDREDYYNGAGADDSIMAGSNGWSNYRHQADICHAYQVIKNHGIPAEHIITMMYDDIANNEENPFPGKIYNTPARKDVYKGVKMDYKGEDLNPKNFLAVLSGNKSAVEGGNGKVIQSTKTDKIFVFFSDHGAPGLIAFPDDVLTVKQLSQTLHSMHRNQKYSELTFYLEAYMKIYAVTAANGHESSWGVIVKKEICRVLAIYSRSIGLWILRRKITTPKP